MLRSPGIPVFLVKGCDMASRRGTALRFVLSLSGLAISAHAQFASVGVDLLSQVPLSAIGAPAPSSGSSCWGYTSPSGREYAILGTNTQTVFVEITNPTSPVIVGGIPHPTSQWNEMIVHGSYC